MEKHSIFCKCLHRDKNVIEVPHFSSREREREREIEREIGHKAYFSKANPDKLFVNGKYVVPDRPLQLLLWVRYILL